MELWILLGALVLLIAFGLYRFFKTRKILNTISEEEFRQGYRKAQLIDVREPKEFDGGHILGARNIPLSQLNNRLVEIRKDKPVYLYCQSGARSARAAMTLHKKGYNDLNMLEGGFKKWTGKIKTKK
ncbi:rhodanese-like domain-containing protein [Halobacillus kuroshimensis]|uniref:Rhodanese-like domain-containing protein n=2 Tax=Halobacillus TaxID=45667 RepID=A0A845DQH6_9BACI|nr:MULTISPECIES: rhodanese-like domain-containing protein [Halobacillus]MBN8236605.1 rhodanese-like domain-containing protein [Halobacillus kuroshimensis]MCA1023010.1 rhodanese-like domain-containing protein [Halobacillus litoralis]MYL19750.1 rhodanese-like domain-containing protein [Halobacillus litoralis]MYL28896.1 rhodanese-like domain-containing protein [Halobacillus halophilus]MYL37147.1 rhodanese-like domain-containing protein [Halobacillus litoralis]